jgi:hypothetical protein
MGARTGLNKLTPNRLVRLSMAELLRQLNPSFQALYRFLDRPTTAVRVLVAFLAIHTLLLGYSAYVHSPTLNEPAHLVAGLSH